MSCSSTADDTTGSNCPRLRHISGILINNCYFFYHHLLYLQAKTNLFSFFFYLSTAVFVCSNITWGVSDSPWSGMFPSLPPKNAKAYLCIFTDITYIPTHTIPHPSLAWLPQSRRPRVRKSRKVLFPKVIE